MTAVINAKVSSTYKAGGSTAFDSLPELTETNLGLVVNVTDAFTTTDDFVEGAGFDHPAGTNVAVVQTGEVYRYDVLAGFVDLSSYAAGAKVAEDIAAAVTLPFPLPTGNRTKRRGTRTIITSPRWASVAVDPADIAKAPVCGICPSSETREGIVRLRTASMPETAISGEFWIEKGRE